MSLPNIKWSPVDYLNASFIAAEAGDEMLTRLDWMTIKPQVIVDLGCGLGQMSARLQERYPHATVIAIDSAQAMLDQAKASSANLYVNALAEQLPLPDQSVDLIFANLLLPWHQNVKQLFQECRRVLRPDGLVMLTTFGPDTLQEYVGEGIAPILVDMHDVGDALLQAGFADPVLDVNHYTSTYRDKEKLLQELCASGMLVSVDEVKEIAETEAGIWQITYEMVYAHAFSPAVSSEFSASDGEVKVPLSHLRQQLRGKN